MYNKLLLVLFCTLFGGFHGLAASAFDLVKAEEARLQLTGFHKTFSRADFPNILAKRSNSQYVGFENLLAQRTLSCTQSRNTSPSLLKYALRNSMGSASLVSLATSTESISSSNSLCTTPLSCEFYEDAQAQAKDKAKAVEFKAASFWDTNHNN